MQPMRLRLSACGTRRRWAGGVVGRIDSRRGKGVVAHRGAEGFGGGFSDGAADEFKDGAGFGETRLHFGGVGVDIDGGGGQVEKKRPAGLAVVAEVAQRIGGGALQDSVADESSVDVKKLPDAFGGGAEGGGENRAAQFEGSGVFAGFQQVVFQDGKEVGQALEGVLAGGEFQAGSSVGGEGKRDIRRGEGGALDGDDAVGVFGGVGSQESSAGGQVGEEVAGGDFSSRRGGDGGGGRGVFTGGESPSVGRFGRTGDDDGLRGGGQTGEGFAAESEGSDGVEVFGGFGFAGGVSAEGDGQVVGRDAFAVVADFHHLDAAFFQGDIDARGAGVEGVFQQFFEGGGRALDDLPRGDARGDRRRQFNNAIWHGENG